MSLSPAANIATTVAKAMAERGDDVGPNVTLVLLAELEANQQRIKTLEAAVKAWEAQNAWLAKRLGRALLRLDAAQALINRPEVMEVLGLEEVGEADPDVADTAWAIIAHHRQHRTAG